MFKNLLALIGLLSIIAVGGIYFKSTSTISEFDSGAVRTYTELFSNILKYKDAATATVWKYKVAEGLSAEDVEETMKFVANEHNIANVGELPLSKDISAKSGKEYRFVKIFLFCNSLTAAKMLDYNDAFSAYLPCRVTLVEDTSGQLWVYSLNMDLMIHGGKPLPADLKEEAEKVKEIILDIMKRGAEGDF